MKKLIKINLKAIKTFIVKPMAKKIIIGACSLAAISGTTGAILHNNGDKSLANKNSVNKTSNIENNKENTKEKTKSETDIKDEIKVTEHVFKTIEPSTATPVVMDVPLITSEPTTLTTEAPVVTETPIVTKAPVKATKTPTKTPTKAPVIADKPADTTTQNQPETPVQQTTPTETPVVGRGERDIEFENALFNQFKRPSTNNYDYDSISCVLTENHYNFFYNNCEKWFNGEISREELLDILSNTYYPGTQYGPADIGFKNGSAFDGDVAIGEYNTKNTVTILNDIWGKHPKLNAAVFLYVRCFYNSSTNVATVYIVAGLDKCEDITPGLEGEIPNHPKFEGRVY